MSSPCPLIDLSGPPYDRGVSYGRQAGRQIALSVGQYASQLAALSLDWSEVAAIIGDYLPIIDAFDSSYVEEMRGVAAGSGHSLEQIVLINARTEVLKLAVRPDLRASLAASIAPDGCTAVVVQPSATQNGRLIHAHNWDWKYECAETSIVLRIRREDGPDILTLTEAGALGRFGFNAAGIAVTANYLESDRDYRQAGVPLALIRRKVLEQERLALALRAVQVTAKSGSNNVIVSHASGMVFNFECAPDEAFLVEPERGVLIHANHWRSPVALTKLKDVGMANFPCSLYRDVRARELIAPHIGAITLDHVQATLFDDFESPWSICRPPRPSAMTNLSATVATLIMEPSIGRMDVAMLPALDQHFTSYTLEMDSASVRLQRATA